MSFAAMEKIADAVLFEGYILYPYRPSSIKNQRRWNFGTLYPRELVEAAATDEAWCFQAEVLVRADDCSQLTARVRFLELASREAESAQWAEGFVRTRDVDAAMAGLCARVERRFDLSELSEAEKERAPTWRRSTPMIGRLALEAERLQEDLFRLRAVFANESPAGPSALCESSSPGAFISAHLLLHIDSGEFVSMLEPAEDLRTAVSECRQQGVFPVLAGDAGQRNRMLCSPIILYDYPKVAPESAGDFFDGTEMDEMLALRVMTLTDEEKAEMRRSDPRAREILERTELLPAEHLAKLHGAVRGLRPVMDSSELPREGGPQAIDGRMEDWDPFAERPPVESVRVFGTAVRRGDRVRLWPQKKADIMDMAMEGKVAIIEAIEQDLEDQIQFAVVLEDDPGRDMGMLRQAGHRFFFSPEEIEPLSLEAS